MDQLQSEKKTSCLKYSIFAGPYGNHGCAKGQVEIAFEYAIDMGGIDTEESQEKYS